MHIAQQARLNNHRKDIKDLCATLASMAFSNEAHNQPRQAYYNSQVMVYYKIVCFHWWILNWSDLNNSKMIFGSYIFTSQNVFHTLNTASLGIGLKKKAFSWKNVSDRKKTELRLFDNHKSLIWWQLVQFSLKTIKFCFHSILCHSIVFYMERKRPIFRPTFQCYISLFTNFESFF